MLLSSCDGKNFLMTGGKPFCRKCISASFPPCFIKTAETSQIECDLNASVFGLLTLYSKNLGSGAIAENHIAEYWFKLIIKYLY
jgi:hypothetical protein